MAAIDTYLQQIRTAVYGRDVRSAIANGIEECYNYVSAYDGLDGLDINDIVTNDDLEGYLTKAEASSTYATLASLENYVNYANAETLFATKDELTQNYINAATIADTYATKSQLTNYLPSTDIIAQYVKKTDAESFVTYTDLDSYITKADADLSYIPLTSANDYVLRNDLDAYATNNYVNETFVRQTDFVGIHSFDVIVCDNTPEDIPLGATHKDGAEGSMRPTADTMYKIYLVPRNISDDIHYEKYITVQTDTNTFVWEKFGGSAANIIPSDGGESSTVIDLSDYMKYTEAMETFAAKGSFDNYLEKTIADEKYLSKQELESAISTHLNNLDYATHSDLTIYPSRQEIQDQYATKSQLAAYTNSDDLYRDYATKAYVDSFVITFPTGDNILQMLEVENIPGTVQSIVYNSAGDIDRIIHVRDGTNYRIDSFSFGDIDIIETRTLTTGETLVIRTNTETSQTETTFYKNA